MENNKKHYIGSGKQVDNYDLINLSINLSKIRKEDINEFNGSKYLKLTLGKKREVDQYGKTHSLWVNEFKPEVKEQEKVEPDDLPF
jgi:hypothetical protein